MGNVKLDWAKFFRDRGRGPNRVVRRYDGTLEMTWHVDECDDRYVRLTTSVLSGDCVVVCRDLRDVEADVLGDVGEVFLRVSYYLSHLAGLRCVGGA